ncbi:MAG: ATP-binding cassette domain-containing protein [Alphaproteobacteria bacterium]|nr:ATP-binding cassette domain-containing protein [Alphaproteobacteria bacterium]
MSARKKLQNPTTAPSWPLLQRIGKHYLWAHRAPLLWACGAMLIVAAALGLQAHLIQPLFDNGLIAGRVGVINTVIGAVVMLTLIRGVANYYQLYFMESVGQRVVATLQEQMYAATLRQNLGWFADNPTGTLTSRFVSDLQRLKYAVTQIFNSGLRDAGTVVGLFINMLYQDVGLTLLTLVIVPLTIIPIRRFGRLSRKYSRVNQESTAKMAHHLNQTLMHVRQVQSYAQENFEGRRMHAQVMEVLVSTLKAVRVRALSSPVVEVIGTVAIALIMLYAGRQIADGELSPGAFASFMASLVMLSRPLKGLASLNNNLQEGLAAAQRAFELTDAVPTLQDTPGAQPLAVKSASVGFENVTLTYPDGTIALRNFTLHIPAGKTVALVGPSGAGKSSVLNLLPRFYEASQGVVKIAGKDVRSLTLKSLRQHIGLVSQDVAIFDDTIAGNIAYAEPKAAAHRIVAAAKAAAAHAFIAQLPEGYATMLGENGLKLSGGQKQRLALARALLKDAPVLLLDEATASLDTASEKAVQAALERAEAGRTTLIVAHRLSTIVHADEIVVLEAGQIVEQGTHRQLLAKKGLYAKLWRLQGAA